MAISLLAEVALNYIDLRTYQARLLVAESNVKTQQETWELLNALSRAGSGDELAVAQALYNLENSKAKLPTLEVGREAAMNRLALLLGLPAGALHNELSKNTALPQASVKLAIGIPADIIRQRPDIRKAERELAAQTARVGVAQADLYPHFKLNGSIGLEAISINNFLSTPGRFWSGGPTFSWPIFDAGAIRNNVKIQEELQQQAFLAYKQSILSALEEVENALVAYAREQQRLENLRKASAAARQAAELAGYQYTTGLTGFSDVLDAQRSLLSFEDQLVQSKGNVLASLVGIYKTLGGGWQSIHLTVSPHDSK